VGKCSDCDGMGEWIESETDDENSETTFYYCETCNGTGRDQNEQEDFYIGDKHDKRS
jgi:DnaJ-class molecular chaperone